MPKRLRDWPRPPARLTIAQLDEDARRPLSPRGQAMEREHGERQRLRARAQAEGLDLSPCPELPRPLGSRTWDDLAREGAILTLRTWLAEGLAKANAPGQELSERFAQVEELLRETLIALEDVSPTMGGE